MRKARKLIRNLVQDVAYSYVQYRVITLAGHAGRIKNYKGNQRDAYMRYEKAKDALDMVVGFKTDLMAKLINHLEDALIYHYWEQGVEYIAQAKGYENIVNYYTGEYYDLTSTKHV